MRIKISLSLDLNLYLLYFFTSTGSEEDKLPLNEIEFDSFIKFLIDRKIVEVFSNDNQKAENIRNGNNDLEAYRITLKGAVLLDEEEKKGGLNAYIDKHGKVGALIVGVVGLLSVGSQFFFDYQDYNRSRQKPSTEYKEQETKQEDAQCISDPSQNSCTCNGARCCVKGEKN